MEAAVTLLEYGDFECRHCVEAFAMVKEIMRWLRGELRIERRATINARKDNVNV